MLRQRMTRLTFVVVAGLVLAGAPSAFGVSVGINVDIHQDNQGDVNDFHIEGYIRSGPNGGNWAYPPQLIQHIDDIFPNFSYSITPDLSDPEQNGFFFVADWWLDPGQYIGYCNVIHLGLFFNVAYENIMVDLIGWWTLDGERVGQIYGGLNEGFFPIPGFEVSDNLPNGDFIRIVNGDIIAPPGPQPIPIEIIAMDLFPVADRGELEALLGPDPFAELRDGGAQAGLPWIPVGRIGAGFVPISRFDPEPIPPDSFFDVFFEIPMPGQLTAAAPFELLPGGFLLARQQFRFTNNSGVVEERWTWEVHGVNAPPEACCLPDGSCLDIEPSACQIALGMPMGPGTNCGMVVCPQPPEACCLPDGSCIDVAANDCVNIHGGIPQGAGTDCSAVVCDQPTEACCYPDGTCMDELPSDCFANGGLPQGAGTDCLTTICDVRIEACCLPDGSCLDVPPDECVNLHGGTPQGAGTDCTTVVCEGPQEGRFEFSLDIGSDTELSDPFVDGDEGFDPGDIYWWQGPPVTPNQGVLGGRDGFKDDALIFINFGPGSGPFDPWPDPPDFAVPPLTAVPVGKAPYGPEHYHEFFDLDGHDQIDFSLIEFIPPTGPLAVPLPMDQMQPTACVYEPEFLMVSYDDDDAPGWPARPIMSVPVTSPSPFAGNIYGTSGNADEIIGVNLALVLPLPLPVVGTYPIADETMVHQSLMPNPDNGDHDDDDVDSLDIVFDEQHCPILLFTPDHEATYFDFQGFPLDPGGIYERTAVGPVQVIDESIHLGIPEETDIDAFELTWVVDFEGTGALSLAILFSVDDDDPLTPANESGGLAPNELYVSFLSGWSMRAAVLHDDVDALTIWRAPMPPAFPPCPPADVNCDGTPDVLDLGIVRQGANWNQSPPATPRADVNGDGTADVLDLGVIRQGSNWNVSFAPCYCP